MNARFHAVRTQREPRDGRGSGQVPSSAQFKLNISVNKVPVSDSVLSSVSNDRPIEMTVEEVIEVA
jgi:hypothetical protein